MAKLRGIPRDQIHRTFKVRADVIERLRQKAGLSLEALSNKSIVAVNTIKRWMRGQPATLGRLHRVACVLGATTDEVIECEKEIELPPSQPPKRFDGHYVCTVRIPVPFGSFDPKQQIPILIEQVESLLQSQGEITVSFVREGSVLIGIQFSEEADVRALVRYFAEAFERGVWHPEGFLDCDKCSVLPADLDLAPDIAQALAPITFPPGRVGPKALERELRSRTDFQSEFIVLSEHFHGSIQVTRSSETGWTIENKLFLVEPEIHELVRLANELDFPELLAGKLPPRFDNLSKTIPSLAQILQRIVSCQTPFQP